MHPEPSPPAHADQDGTLAVVACERIRRMILEGELAGGTVVQDRRLAEILGLSRTPVREALGRLAGEGYLRRDGRVLTVNAVSVEDVMEILAVRRVIEVEAARLAVGRLSPERIDQIRNAINGMVAVEQVSPERHWSIDDLVHLSIAEAAGNKLILRLVTELRDRTRMFGLSRIPRRFEPGKSEHLAILDAIARGDADAAGAAMRAHIENARTGILDLLAGRSLPG